MRNQIWTVFYAAARSRDKDLYSRNMRHHETRFQLDSSATSRNLYISVQIQNFCLGMYGFSAEPEVFIHTFSDGCTHFLSGVRLLWRLSNYDRNDRSGGSDSSGDDSCTPRIDHGSDIIIQKGIKSSLDPLFAENRTVLIGSNLQSNHSKIPFNALVSQYICPSGKLQMVWASTGRPQHFGVI